MKLVFVSNYINHHQIPFCNAMYETLEGSFAFIQTEAVEQERIRMGWKETQELPYLKLYDQEPEACRRLIQEARVVLFGGTDEECYIQKRLKAGKAVIRYSERLYKTGQWKAVSPKGLRKKYHDHTRYRKEKVYLLCAGAYVPSDFHIVRAYPGKMYRWGYFTEARHYDVDQLLKNKGWQEKERMVYLLWAARMIDWKHPELAVETARHLQEKGIKFHMDLIGDGPLREQTENLARKYGLEGCVDFLGFQTPEKVRDYMEKADIFLFTSDRQEGWGAVANEAMNSGCALVADHMIGAVPYLVKDGINGLVYEDGNTMELFGMTERLATDRELAGRLGRNAYETITKVWNGENAAARLGELCIRLGLLEEGDFKEKTGSGTGTAVETGKEPPKEGPCSAAPVISERRMYRLLKGKDC